MKAERPQPPSVDIDDVVGVYLTEALYPDLFQRRIEPWRMLIRKPTWRHAKPLMAEHPDRVSSILERLVDVETTGSRDPDALMGLAMVRRTRGDHAGALPLFEALADRGGPERYKAYYNVGLCLAALGRVAEARRALGRVLEQRPADERALRALAELPT